MSFEAFRAEVDRLLFEEYGLSWTDACGEEEPLRTAREAGEEPRAFVAWWAGKYGLEARREWSGGWATRRG